MSEKNSEKNQIGIDDKIREVLTGDSLKNALDFTAFLRANRVTLTSNNDGSGWAVGGIVGNSLGFMMVNGAANMPGPWTMWFNTCDFKDNGAVDDETKQAAWDHASECGRCNAGWKTCGNGDRHIFGKKFENRCHSPLMFTNPDSKTLESVKKLILMLQ